MIHSYPSIYNLGHKALENLFSNPVVVEEKVDGSQFSFGLIDGKLTFRSKGSVNVDAMFMPAIEYVKSIEGLLSPGVVYRGEFLGKPKHNSLAYSRIPLNHIVLFDIDIGGENYLTPDAKAAMAGVIGLEVVPLFFVGTINSWEDIKGLLDTESFLGGQKVEGVVIKNYEQFGPDKKVLMGKFVSEEFKEVHGREWRASNPNRSNILESITESLRTEARWNKAIQHLRDSGELTNDVQDIGPLMREVSQDITKEEKEYIKDKLYEWARKDILRGTTKGLPEWYKEKLAKESFE